MTARKSVSPSLQSRGAGNSRVPTPKPSPTDDRVERTRRREGKGLKTIRFTIFGPLVGYRASWTRHNKRYHDFKSSVLLLAMESGFQNNGTATKEESPRLTVRVYWKNDPRIDWANVYKCIEDSLWYESDRFVQPGDGSGFFCNDGGKYGERAEVEIRYGV